MSKYLRVGFVLVCIVIIVVAVALWQDLHSFVFAWVLNFTLMFGVLYATETFKPKLASTYYISKKWEAGGRIYKWFGFDAFSHHKSVLQKSFWIELNLKHPPYTDFKFKWLKRLIG